MSRFIIARLPTASRGRPLNPPSLSPESDDLTPLWAARTHLHNQEMRARIVDKADTMSTPVGLPFARIPGITP